MGELDESLSDEGRERLEDESPDDIEQRQECESGEDLGYSRRRAGLGDQIGRLLVVEGVAVALAGVRSLLLLEGTASEVRRCRRQLIRYRFFHASRASSWKGLGGSC